MIEAPLSQTMECGTRHLRQARPVSRLRDTRRWPIARLWVAKTSSLADSTLWLRLGNTLPERIGTEFLASNVA
jgi:hypothetical protein